MIIYSTKISFFSNLIFKGVTDIIKTGKKKSDIKVHSVIHANEGASCDMQFISASTNDSFMLAPNIYNIAEIIAMDCAHIN